MRARKMSFLFILSLATLSFIADGMSSECVHATQILYNQTQAFDITIDQASGPVPISFDYIPDTTGLLDIEYHLIIDTEGEGHVTIYNSSGNHVLDYDASIFPMADIGTIAAPTQIQLLFGPVSPAGGTLDFSLSSYDHFSRQYLPFHLNSLSLQVTTTSSPVPEPGTVGLMGIGLLGLVAFRRARRHKHTN